MCSSNPLACLSSLAEKTINTAHRTLPLPSGRVACVTRRLMPLPRLRPGLPKTCVGSAPRRLPKTNLGGVSRLSPGNCWAEVMPKKKINEAFMKEDSIARLISHLETLGGIGPGATPDRRALAGLRRSLATWPSAPTEAIRVVAPFLPEQATGWRETVYYLIAALFALHPCLSNTESGRGPSLGLALHQAALRDSAQGPERRLLALLGCKSEDLQPSKASKRRSGPWALSRNAAWCRARPRLGPRPDSVLDKQGCSAKRAAMR